MNVNLGAVLDTFITDLLKDLKHLRLVEQRATVEAAERVLAAGSGYHQDFRRLAEIVKVTRLPPRRESDETV